MIRIIAVTPDKAVFMEVESTKHMVEIADSKVKSFTPSPHSMPSTGKAFIKHNCYNTGLRYNGARVYAASHITMKTVSDNIKRMIEGG